MTKDDEVVLQLQLNWVTNLTSFIDQYNGIVAL